MRKVLVLAEGPTEERFIKEVLNAHLQAFQIHLQPVIVATKRVNAGGKFKGGVPSYEKVRKELLRLLGDSSALIVTTIFDFYGLPESFPGRAAPEGATPLEKVCFVERAWSENIANARFRPYLSLHEFEALLFVSPQAIAQGFSRPELLTPLQRIRRAFATPEDINDDPETAPSARLQKLFPRYSKPFFGTLISRRIGLADLRSECNHFADWLKMLEKL
jgi:hypothetical protein